MLETIKRVGDDFGRGLGRAWDSVAEGWRELWRRSSDALTQFTPQRAASRGPELPRWALLTGEVEETKRELVVRIEILGLSKADLDVSVHDRILVVRGEKRVVHDEEVGTWHLSERAYGCFERIIPLPTAVDADSACAAYKDGVLTVRLRKTTDSASRRITVT